ncbi:kinase-like protein [Polyplosphaeria fusca]|uniref:Kinase-like protein n=1 Tax=Polyplosphaeria fusca TaxID=682080 RepID=A0A9P4QS18_9PLEO|nr:kinase-like protein [Polyplosphaeria fusca]
MPPASITLQPCDRDTGAVLSSEEQTICQSNYVLIKSYIDHVERRTDATKPWVRKRLRCSTSELLASIETLAEEIRQKGIGDTYIDTVSQDTVLASNSIEDEEETDPSSYQNAVNILHELVSRLAVVSDTQHYALRPPPSGRFSNLDTIVPGGNSSWSETSTPLSNSISVATSSETNNSADPCSSKTSDESDSHIMSKSPSRSAPESVLTGKAIDFRNQNGVDHSSQSFGSAITDVKTELKLKTTNDWILEYLRGGLLANSLPGTIEGGPPSLNVGPVDSVSAESFHRLLRSDSDEAYLSLEASRSPAGTRSFTTSKRPGVGRPIPTVTMHFKEKSLPSRDATHHRLPEASGPDLYRTPRSIMSGATVYHTPDSGSVPLGSHGDTRNSAWNSYLREKGLIPTPFDEMDWSGRGQHAEFEATEEAKIPLTLERTLGHSATALVESVRCKRIRLARKTVEVSRRLKKEEAVREVAHLQRLKHPHIIRVVGTYTLPRKLSILLYPVADYTLDQFIDSVEDDLASAERSARLYSISTFLRCLAKGLDYIHCHAMKHMDIKPKNLLVRCMRHSSICNQGPYKIYIADFNIARSYRSIDDCVTDSPTAYTRAYAAPEVVAQESRDQKADIFSLGAVFAEMLAVLADEQPGTSNPDALLRIRESNEEDRSYQGNVIHIQAWLRNLDVSTYGFESDSNHSHITELVARMLSEDPKDRPNAANIVENIPFAAFCCDVNGGAEPFEAADRPNSARQLYDRAFQISDAELTCFRCMVDGCVKVYWSREKLEYHIQNGHGEDVESLEAAGKLQLVLDGEISNREALKSREMNEPNMILDYKALHEELTEHMRWG